LTRSGAQHPFEHVQKRVARGPRGPLVPTALSASRAAPDRREAAHAALTTCQAGVRFPIRTVIWIKKRGMVAQALPDLVKGRTRYPPWAGGYSMA